MAEGDTVLRAARRLEAALAGEALGVRAPNPRGRVGGVEQLDGRTLDGVESRGKHLLLCFGDLVLHSHLGMSGSWRVRHLGGDLGRPAGSAWAILTGPENEAAQFGGPTLRVLGRSEVTRDRVLGRLGPDILAPDLDIAAASASLARGGGLQLGEGLLDQRLVAGIGNIFKSEACFAARINPLREVDRLSAEELGLVLGEAQRLMSDAVAARAPRSSRLPPSRPALPPLRHADRLSRAGRRQPAQLLVPELSARGLSGRQAGEVGEPVAGVLLVVEAGLARPAPREPRVVKWGSPKSSPTTSRPSGLQDAPDLAQGGRLVGDLAEDGGQDDGVDRGVLVGELGRVALGRDDVRATACEPRITWSRNSCWRSKISTLPSGPTQSAMSKV